MATLKDGVNASLGLLPLQLKILTAVSSEKSTEMTNVCLGRVCPDCLDTPGKVGGKKCPTCDGTQNVVHTATKINSFYRCPICKNEDKNTLAKAKAVSKTELVVVPKDEIDAMSAEAKKITENMAITLHPAVDVEDSTLETGTVYYAAPASAAFNEVYALVVKAIKDNPDTAFVTMWAARSAPAMYRFDVRGDVLIIRQLAWPERVQSAPAVPNTFNPMFEAQLGMFLAAAKVDFDPTTYRDNRGDILANYVASQTPVVGYVPEPKEGKAPTVGGIDIMAALAASTAAATAPAKKAPAKRAAKVVKSA